MQACSDMVDLSDKFLSCSICAEGFGEGPLTPRLLPCQHSFCSRCVDNIGSSETFNCPLCCKAIPCDADTTPSEQFPKNRTLISLLDWVQSTKMRKGRSQPGETLKVCELHEDERRKFFCRTCGVTVCPCCALDSHRQGHDLDSVQSVLQQARQSTHHKASVVLRKLLVFLPDWDGESNSQAESGEELATALGHRTISVPINDDVTVMCPYFAWNKHPQSSVAAEACTPEAKTKTSGPYPVGHFRGIVGKAPLPRDAVTYWQVEVSIPPGVQAERRSPVCEVGLANKAAIRACGEADSLGLMDAGSSGNAGWEAKTVEVVVFPDESTVSVAPVTHYDTTWSDVTSVRTGSLTRCTLGFLLNGPMQTLRMFDVTGVETLWVSPVDLREVLWPVAVMRGSAVEDEGVRVELQSGEEVMRHALRDLLRKLTEKTA